MAETKGRISRTELYSGSMIFFIALFHLLSVGSRFFQASLHPPEWQDIKTGLFALFFFVACILFFRVKKSGWIMATGILMNFVLMMCMLIFSLAGAGAFNSYAALAVMLFLLLLLAFVFLFSRETRRKYAVNNKSYLLAIMVYICLLMANFFPA